MWGPNEAPDSDDAILCASLNHLLDTVTTELGFATGEPSLGNSLGSSWLLRRGRGSDMRAVGPATYLMIIRSLWIGLAVYALSGCAEVQMGYNVLTYDDTVADTANQLLLLNAVRASQHYPQSFTSVGQLVASPPVSGSIASTLNFANPGGLQTANLNPTINANPGYSQFALGNLNASEFMAAIRKPVPFQITQSFRGNPRWPHQLIELIYVQNYVLTEPDASFVDSSRKHACSAPANDSQARSCEKMADQIAEYTQRCGSEHFVDFNTRMREFHGDPRMYYNTPSNFCHFARFKIFLEEVGLVCNGKPGRGCPRRTERSPLDMIGYLGELIAAQNYIEEPFVPLVTIGYSTTTGFKFADVPLFEVKRGPPLGGAAVAVQHEGTTFYIPKPDFGSPTEARSLQTLDLVLQTVQAATHRKDLPSTLPSFGVISGK